MAQPQQLAYFGIDRPTLPYRSFTSPVDESPHFVPGSQNVLALASGWLTKRPGWSDALEPALSAVPGQIVRVFSWKRWAGSTTNPDALFVMLGVIAPDGHAQVWKLNLSADQSFSLLWTETTLTGVPFDFQDSNNFVFFGNASTRSDMRKYDGTDCTLWGLDAPPAAPSFEVIDGALPAGMTFDQANGIFSGTPTRAGTSLVTVTVTDQTGTTAMATYSLEIADASLRWVTPAGQLQPAMAGSNYAGNVYAAGGTGTRMYTLFSGTLPAGVTLASNGTLSGTPVASAASQSYGFAIQAADSATPPVTVVRAFSLYVGDPGITLAPADPLPSATVGTAYSTTLTPGGGTAPYSIGFVGGTAPPGLQFTTTVSGSGSTATTAYALAGTPTRAGLFPCVIRVTDSSQPPRATELQYTIQVAATALTITTATLPIAQVGQSYSSGGSQIRVSGGTPAYSFIARAGSLSAQTGYSGGYTYTSRYGHESAMSALSTSTGLFTDQDIAWDVIASTDPQVTGINFYRTTDGGDVAAVTMRLVAALPNATVTFRDSTPDEDLGVQTGPADYINAPPQPLRGFAYSTSRIWGFNSGAVWFTGDEEVTNGVAAESMSNARNGNFYRWPSETFALAVTDNGVDSLLAEQVWQVSGDTLDTFRKTRILTGGGALSPTTVCVVGTIIYWLDTARQLWSSTAGELGSPIRPDLAAVDHRRCYLVYHKAGQRNWLLLLDATTAATARVFAYDFDLNQWQTPWTVPGATALATVQTDVTTLRLACAFASGHVRLLALGTDGTYTGYDDDGQTYADQLRLNLLPIVPGRGTTARNSESTRQVAQWEMETDVAGENEDGTPAANVPDQFYSIVDDSPLQPLDAAWSPLTLPQPLQYSRTDALALAATRWPEQDPPAGRRVAMAAVWQARATGWNVYSFDLAIKPKL